MTQSSANRELLEIDHVVVAVRDLEKAARRFQQEYGLRSIVGGRHPGHGTGNRLIPLGDAYIELMAVVDGVDAENSPLGRSVAARTAEGDRPFIVCMRCDDVAAVASRLSLATMDMSRVKPNGTELRMSLAGLDEAIGPDMLPFFIQWHVEPGEHPAEMSVHHDVESPALHSVTIGGDEDRIRSWLGDATEQISVAPGERGVCAIEIATADGTAVIV